MAAAVALSNLALMAALFFLVGVITSLVSVGANTAIVWTFKDRSSPLINGLHFMFGIGAFLSPLLVARLLSLENGTQITYWIASGFFILIGLWVLRLDSNPTPQQANKDTQQKERRYDHLLIGLTGMFLLFYVGSEISFSGWFYTYIIHLDLAQETTAALINSAFWLSFTFGRLTSVWVATRVHQKTVLPVALAGSLASLALLLLLPPNVVLLWIIPIALGFFMAPIFPTAFSWVSQSVQMSGKRTGILYVGGSSGGMLLPWLIGSVIDASGNPTVMVPLVLGGLALNLLAYFGLLAANRAQKRL